MSHLIKQAISNTNMVFLIDCKSVLRSVQNVSQDNATSNFKHLFSIISRTNNAELQLIPTLRGITGNESALQLIPALCGITGNRSAEELAKQASECQQHRHRVSPPKMKTLVKGKFNTAWKTRTGSTYPSDPIRHLNRREQTMLFRLRTGHCRLGAQLYKLKVITTPQCHCNTEHQTLEKELPTAASLTRKGCVVLTSKGSVVLTRKGSVVLTRKGSVVLTRKGCVLLTRNGCVVLTRK